MAYGATGALAFTDMATALAAADSREATVMLIAASAFIFTGLGFKLSLVPFHMWTPDVYQGSPMPVTGFLAAVSKAAVFAVLLRLFLDAELYQYDAIMRMVGLVGILSMLAGNLLALLQTNLKRMLAYSSIAHIGYLLIVLVASRTAGNRALAEEAAIYYLVAYAATTIAAFSLLTLVGLKRTDRGSTVLGSLSGLFWQRPLLASLMLVTMLSLAGIPLTAGFIGKLYLVQAGVAGSHWIMLGALVIGSGIGIYYYLRVVFYMARRPEDTRVTLLEGDEALPGTVLACALIALVLWLGIAPQPLIDYVRTIL
jgi:NADH-quinone oxidoreductase subunit N